MVKLNKNNQFIATYIRMLKEENLYEDKNFRSNIRYMNVLNTYKTPIDSMLYNIELPNLLISEKINYRIYWNFHCRYMIKIGRKIINKAVEYIKENYTPLSTLTEREIQILKETIFKEFQKQITYNDVSSYNMMACAIQDIMENYYMINRNDVLKIMKQKTLIL